MPTMLRKGILGTKIGMTRIFSESGDAVPCTLVEAGPCTVIQRKTKAADGYDAYQIGFGTRRDKLLTKPLKGHLKRANVESTRHLREVRLVGGETDVPEVGAKITCDLFRAGDFVDVVGRMKGRGYQGVVRRHGFPTATESHGSHYFWRHGGSIGCRKPQHTVRGTRMAGHMGDARRTVQSLEVLRVEPEKNLLYLKGALPGANGGLVLVRQAKKRAPKAS